MTTIHRRIGTPTVRSITRKAIRLDSRFIHWLILTAFGVLIYFGGIWHGRAMEQSANGTTFLQNQLVQSYGDNNRAQAAMAATIDEVDRSSYWTGWYGHCVYDKGIAFEEACWEAAEKEMGK